MTPSACSIWATIRKETLNTMGLKLIPPGQGDKLREYYLRFEGSTYGV